LVAQETMARFWWDIVPERDAADLYAEGLFLSKRYAEAIDCCRGLYRTLHGDCLAVNTILLRSLYKTEQDDEVMRFGKGMLSSTARFGRYDRVYAHGVVQVEQILYRL